MVLVPVILFFCSFWSLQNILFLKIVSGTIFKNKIFYRDLFKNQNILQGLFFYKMGSIIMCHMCKSSQKWDQNENETYLQGPKTKKNKITGPKTKTRHICREQNHILAFKIFLPGTIIPSRFMADRRIGGLTRQCF